jgi:hypothetical protein
MRSVSAIFTLWRIDAVNGADWVSAMLVPAILNPQKK